MIFSHIKRAENFEAKTYLADANITQHSQILIIFTKIYSSFYQSNSNLHISFKKFNFMLIFFANNFLVFCIKKIEKLKIAKKITEKLCFCLTVSKRKSCEKKLCKIYIFKKKLYKNIFIIIIVITSLVKNI